MLTVLDYVKITPIRGCQSLFVQYPCNPKAYKLGFMIIISLGKSFLEYKKLENWPRAFLKSSIDYTVEALAVRCM